MVTMTDVKVKLESYVEEDEWLCGEVRDPVGNPLQLTLGGDYSTVDEDEVINSYETQAQLFKQERIQVMEVWQTAILELDRLQEFYENLYTDGLNPNAKLSHKHPVTNQELPLTNYNLTEQSPEVEELHNQLRTTKADLRTAIAKTDEMTQQLQLAQHQLKRQEEEVAEGQSREEAAQRQIQQLQTALSQQEDRIKAASQEAENAQKSQTMWEKTSANLKARCATLEQEKYEAVDKVRECVQMAEEAALQRDEALLRTAQLTQELEKTKRKFQQAIQDAAVCSQKEVTQIREQCNTEMQSMAQELSLLQLECADKQSQIERFKRERRAFEEELQKVTKGRVEQEFGQISALHQQMINAEQMKEEMSITLQSTQSKLKKLETEHNEQLSRSQEEVERLRGCLAAARGDCVRISDERLQLQQENVQSRREMDKLFKTYVLIQTKAKQQMMQMDEEYSKKEKTLKAQMSDLENSSRSSIADLMRLLTAQQKSIQRWKMEAPNMAQAFEAKIKNLLEELNQQQQWSHELELQLRNNNGTIAEYERQLAELQEKTSRLQRRLTEVEQRATASSQQLLCVRSKTEGVQGAPNAN
ncbi:sodium channel and clathrin linker 1-like isoform X2 [Dunckerocampus dactyliophorus]|uniref:sodium channel and clathrin linker 1-like isoform X2 n=1 Tax=Dunckerocampus dactyliophorus TaxID=161453 RepID=UPI002405AB3E|nr:sodium channel and clathrin linker 1-like isoform X2 [Dunckerocampus dactyliophorus]